MTRGASRIFWAVLLGVVPACTSNDESWPPAVLHTAREGAVEILESVSTEAGEARAVSFPPGADTPVPLRPRDLRTVVVRSTVRQPAARYRVQPSAHAPFRLPEPAGPAAARPRGAGFAAGAATGGAVSSAALTAPASLDVVFESTRFDDNAVNTGGRLFIPADPIGAAGPDHVISVTNVTVRFHEKDGTTTFDAALSDFFADLAPQTFTFDPKVIYDQFAGRFVVLTTEFTDIEFGFPTNLARFFVGVSDDADPNGAWSVTEIDAQAVFFNARVGATVPHWADFPGLAVDEEAIYITADMNSFFSYGGQPGGVRLWTVDKGLGSGGLYDGGAVDVNLLDPYAGGGVATTTQPAHVFGDTPATPDVGTFLVSYSGLTNGLLEAVQVVRVDDPLGAVSFTQEFVPVGDLEDFLFPQPDAPQLGSAVRLDTNKRRALHAVWRDDGLYMTAHTVPRAGTPDAGEVTAHWWQLDTGALGATALADQGAISGDDIAPGTFTYFPSIAVNSQDVMAVGFCASSPTTYSGVYVAYRAPDDPPGATSPALAVREGQDYYVRTFGGGNRWGDFSGVAVDPVDDCFWVYNNYARTRGLLINGEDGRWGTAFGKLCVDQCGNGVVQPGEACDDGNEIDGDLCANDCTLNVCGEVDTDGDGFGDGCDADDDDDGALDPEDCAPLDPALTTVPAEVTGLIVEPAGSSWDGQGETVVYDVIGGELTALRADGGIAGASCLANGLVDADFIDGRAKPPPGEGLYHLVRARNACGTGSWGAERPEPLDCP